MNKSQLIDVVALKSNFTKKDAEIAVNATIETIIEALKCGDKVQIVGFGSFETREVAAKEYINHFGNGEKIQKMAQKKVSFSSSKVLKDEIN